MSVEHICVSWNGLVVWGVVTGTVWHSLLFVFENICVSSGDTFVTL